MQLSGNILLMRYVDVETQSKLNIGIFFTNLHGIGGASSAEMSYYEQIRDSIGKRHNLTLILNSKKNTLLDFDKSLAYVNLNMRIFSKIIFFIQSLKFIQDILSLLNIQILSTFEKKLIQKRVDIVFSLGINPITNSLQQIPYLTFIWDVGHLELNSFPEINKNNGIVQREEMYRVNILKARGVITESEIGKSNILNYYKKNPEMIYSIPFVPESNLKDYLKNNQRECIAYYPAQFWPHKNHKVLLLALKMLLDKKINPRKIIFTGSDQGNLNNILNLSKKLGVFEFIEYRGFVSKEEVYSIYQECDLVVMPSLLGPTNFPPLEALLLGAPVAASTIDGFKPEIKKLLHYISPFDINGWSKILDSQHKTHLPDKVKISKIFRNIRESNLTKFDEIINDMAQEISLIK